MDGSKLYGPISFEKGSSIKCTGERSVSLNLVNEGRGLVHLWENRKKNIRYRIDIPLLGWFTREEAPFRQVCHDVYAGEIKNSQICQIKRCNLKLSLLKYPSFSLKILTEFVVKRLESAENFSAKVAAEKVETRTPMYPLEWTDWYGLKVSSNRRWVGKGLASHPEPTP